MPPGRKLNALEAKLHQAALAAARPLTQKEIDRLATDAKTRTEAMNFLLGAGMLKVMEDNSRGLTYSAIMKEEVDLKKGLSGDELIVLNHIQAAKTQGIWTKHLKAKTGLHQTVLDRCLKQLSQKRIIKTVKGAANYPTRKIYMMANLDPSVELTGGPWYTDGELDDEFIKLLSSACLRFIQTRSFPKNGHSLDNPASARPLYAISDGHAYPTLQQVLQFLHQSKITDTQLAEEHVETLLNTLILDGEVEKLPAFGTSMWAATDIDGSSDKTGESETDAAPKVKKRKVDKVSRLKLKSREHRDEGETSSSSEAKDTGGKQKRHRHMSEESDAGRGTKNPKRRKIAKTSVDDIDNEDTKPVWKSSSKSPSRSGRGSSSSDTDEVSSPRRPRIQSKSHSKSRTYKETSPDTLEGTFTSGAHVYRAIHQERVTMGWSQAPCAPCRSFSFCRDGGPVEPKECVYYREWLA